MRINRLLQIALTIFLLAIPTLATDYAVDPTFNPTFRFSDFNVDNSIGDLVVQADGKLVIGGTFTEVNGETNYYIARLNPDGTRDTTFNSGILPGSGILTYVRHITPLPDGKFLVTGKFRIGNEYSSFLKLNSDGSIDGSLSHYVQVGEKIVPLADGKFLVCGGRLVNDEPYQLAHRLNADGSIDPSFRITFSRGICKDIQLQPDGKILMSGSFYITDFSYFEPMQRFNPDGSHDPTFNLQTSSAYGAEFSLLSDGKIIVSYGQGPDALVKRFNPDGSVDQSFPYCQSLAFLPLSDGSILMNGCRKWPTGPLYQFGRVLPSGRLEPSLDWMNFQGTANGSQGVVNNFRRAPDGKFYAFGNFNSVDGNPRAKIVRLMPYAAPVKAKFDFDGDGRSDISIFRPSNRYWYVSRSAAGPLYLQWGLATDKLAAADYDFDGATDIGVFRESDGNWFASASTSGYTFVAHGQPGDRPFTADFDNDGKNDWTVRRVTGGSVSWRIKRGGSTFDENLNVTIDGELATDRPVLGDFDGDHRDELGYFRDGFWYTRDFGSGAPVESFRWGVAGDIPVAADYDGDGQTDYAIYRPSTGAWWINRSTLGVIAVAFGLSGDVPVPADYDGDGKVDIAIFRNGEWWQYLSGTSSVRVDSWGVAGDLAVPAQAQ